MESKWVNVLDNRRHKLVESKRMQAAQCDTKVSEASHKTFLLRSKHESLRRNLGKRKRPDSCGSKSVMHLRKSSLKNYSNFMRSGLPERVLFYEDSEWKDFPKDIVELVREEFQHKKAAIEVRSNGCHFMLDILYMIQVDLKTASQKPIAWIDVGGCCFFPQLYAADVGIHEDPRAEFEKDEELVGVDPNGTREIKLNLQIELNGVTSPGLEECVQESNANAKKIKIEQKSIKNVLEVGANDDCNDKHAAKGEEVVDNMQKNVTNPRLRCEYVYETIDLESVRNIFLEGMKPSLDVNILDVNECSSNMMQIRREIFQKQIELTQKYRGDPNIHYAWFPATKDVLSSTMTYGLANFGSKSVTTYGLGVHLMPVKCAVTSANYCDVDENGVRHMVFCRVILGNVELVHPGSTQFHPSNESFDNGVDDFQNPSHYIVWNMNMNTHIYPEYVVSFKMPHSNTGKEQCGVPEVTDCLDPSGKAHVGSSVVESGKAPSIGSSTAKTPKSPWMPFTTLFDAISAKVSQGEMNNLYFHYEEMKSKKLSREDFIVKLRSIVGDEMLKTVILGLQNKFPEKAKCVPKSMIGEN